MVTCNAHGNSDFTCIKQLPAAQQDLYILQVHTKSGKKAVEME